MPVREEDAMIRSPASLKEVTCSCPVTVTVVYGQIQDVMDRLRMGEVSARCRHCGAAWTYALGDCFTLGDRRRQNTH